MHTKHTHSAKYRVFVFKTVYVTVRFLGMSGLKILKGLSESGTLILPA